MRAEERPAQIDVDHRVPVGGRQIVERALDVDRRHVDQDVETAKVDGHGVDERRGGRRLREIGLERGGAPLQPAHGVGRLLGLRLRTGIAERHVDAARRELAGDDGADALAAGDERDGVSELHRAVKPG